jgi:hypothetical protein
MLKLLNMLPVLFLSVIFQCCTTIVPVVPSLSAAITNSATIAPFVVSAASVDPLITADGQTAYSQAHTEHQNHSDVP